MNNTTQLVLHHVQYGIRHMLSREGQAKRISILPQEAFVTSENILLDLCFALELVHKVEEGGIQTCKLGPQFRVLILKPGAVCPRMSQCSLQSRQTASKVHLRSV